MKEFFSTKRFKVLVAISIVLGAFMLRAAWTGGFGTLSSSIIGTVTTPFQKLSASISFNVDEFFATFTDAKSIKEENERQKEEIRKLNEKLVEHDKIKHQNDVYKDFLEIKERSADLEIEPASVMGRDASERFYSFTIDKGTLDGIAPRDSVMTKDGFVGIIFEVGLTYAKVSTILDPANNIGVYDTRTRDTALVTGTVELAEKGLCKMYLLPRESGVAVGDLIVTSGISGMYPKEQIIGKVLEVKSESHGNSLYAIIEPSSDIKSIKDVLVVKSFAGEGSSAQGNSAPQSSSSQSSSSQSSSSQSSSSQSSSSQSSSSQSSSPQSSSSQSSAPQSSAPQSSAPQSSAPQSSSSQSSSEDSGEIVVTPSSSSSQTSIPPPIVVFPEEDLS